MAGEGDAKSHALVRLNSNPPDWMLQDEEINGLKERVVKAVSGDGDPRLYDELASLLEELEKDDKRIRMEGWRVGEESTNRRGKGCAQMDQAHGEMDS